MSPVGNELAVEQEVAPSSEKAVTSMYPPVLACSGKLRSVDDEFLAVLERLRAQLQAGAASASGGSRVGAIETLETEPCPGGTTAGGGERDPEWWATTRLVESELDLGGARGGGVARRKVPLGVVDPAGIGKWRWDAIMSVLILYSAIVIPYKICFEVGSSGFSSVLDFVVDALFVLDLAVNFRTAFVEDDGDLVVDSKRIAHHYLRTWFLVDFLSCVAGLFPVLFPEDGEDAPDLRSLKLIRTLRLLRLLKLVRVIKLRRLMEQLEDSPLFSPVWLRLCKLLFQVIFICHLMSCLFYYVAVLDDADRHDWVTDAGVQDSSPWEAWVASSFFILSTMTTTGFGDIHAVTTVERLFVCAVMLIGTSVFGYVIGAVASLVSSLDESSVRTNAKLNEMRSFLEEQNVTTQLRRKILRHLNHQIDVQTAFNEGGLLSTMPRSLRTEVILFVYRRTVRVFPILKHLERSLLAFLVEGLTPALYLPREVIYSLREPSSCAYLLYHGEVSYTFVLPPQEVVMRHHGQLARTDSRSSLASLDTEDGHSEAVPSPKASLAKELMLRRSGALRGAKAQHNFGTPVPEPLSSATQVAPHPVSVAGKAAAPASSEDSPSPAPTSSVRKLRAVDGDVFGLNAVLCPSRYPGSARTITPCECFRLLRDHYMLALRLFPESSPGLEDRLFLLWKTRSNGVLYLPKQNKYARVFQPQELRSLRDTMMMSGSPL